MGWKGKGTQNEPYVIENGENMILDLTARTGDIYIHISNLSFANLTLVNCQNILITNCTIYSLHLGGCKNVIIRDCSLMKVSQLLSRGNTFANNEILDESYTRLMSNSNERNNTILLSIAITLTIIITFDCFTDIFSSNVQWITYTFIVVGLLSIAGFLYFIILKIKVNKYPRNVYSEFKARSSATEMTSLKQDLLIIPTK